MASRVRLVTRTPVEESGGGQIGVKLTAKIDAGVERARAYVLEYMTQLADTVAGEWPRDRHTPASADLFTVTDRSTAQRVDVRIGNAADYSAFVYYPGLGKGPWPGPGPWRLWTDKITRRINEDLPGIKADLASIISSAMRQG